MRLLLPSTTTTTTATTSSSSSSSKSLLALLLFRHYCSSPSPPKLKNLSYRFRARALLEARSALLDYLHATRALPFSLADHIASNSPFSLSTVVSQIRFPPSFTPSQISPILRRFLSFTPINEFDFFFESIGLPPSDPIPSHSPFLSDDAPLLSAITPLVGFGFPWTKLGILYREESSIFRKDPEDLARRLHRFEALGLRRVCVIGICLAFPSVLSGDLEPDSEIDLLFQDLKRVFVDFDLASWVGDDVDSFLQICRRIRVFYDWGSEKGKMGELMGRERTIFLEHDEAALAQKLNFFCKLGMKKKEIGLFILQFRQILEFDLENPDIAMPEYLIGIGLDEEEAISLSKRDPYVMGKNKLGNLPGLLKAVHLQEWFLHKIVNGNYHYLSPAYTFIDSYDRKIEDDFLQDLERIKSVKKKHEFIYPKLEFLLSIGFGENTITTRALGRINGSKEQLQERFDCLLGMGIEYTMLCRMISATPKLFNQSREMLHAKVNYLCHDLNYSLQYLDKFPAFLCFDLENRIKPRYRIINWLKDKGLLKKHFSPATVLANSEKRFMINLLSIHRAAPKQWLEVFSSRCSSNGNRKNILFLPRP